MAIDLNRVIQATADAVLQGQGSGPTQQKRQGRGQKHGLSMPRAFLIGAGVMTAGRLLVGSRGRELLENLQQRLIEYEHDHFESDDGEEGAYEDFDAEAEEDEDFDEDEELDEPEAEEDEEPSGEVEDEPEREDDEDFGEEERPQRRRPKSGAASGSRRSRR